MPNLSASPCHPTAIDCEPVTHASTKVHYDLRNNRKTRNFITAEITARNYFKFYVENLPKTQPQTGCPGRWLFEVAWDHFLSEGINILGIRGEWSFGDNLEEVNRLTANNALKLEDAAMLTWTGLRAGDKGFINVLILDADGSPGSYVSVDVLFLR
jgi:hypothetical protein